MKEPSRQPDRVIHEAMGLCWHEFKDGLLALSDQPYCLRKNCTQMWYKEGAHNPNYSTDLRPVFEWMRANKSWSRFVGWAKFEEKLNRDLHFFYLSDEQQRDLIAEWIESTRDNLGVSDE